MRRAAAPTGALVLLIAMMPMGLFAQRVRIALLSVHPDHSGPPPYSDLARTVSRFDVVAADAVADAEEMEKVLAGMDAEWNGILDRNGGAFGFFYNDRLQIVKELGSYPRRGQFARPPYGVQFRLAGTRFAFNLVICRVEPADKAADERSEIRHLGDVYVYFERLTGNRGITLLAGRFGTASRGAFAPLVKAGGEEVKGSRATLNAERRMFAGSALRPRLTQAEIAATALRPLFVVVNTTD
jgi:hypothetical protein